ncbi:uncharacterized protein LOC131172900 [Hevea brasiliensis]|uniref:uncharacterized protein LOC131172900 n=1 Tax=Hevea brasiliensis TaxID=3981 RepID=UPI0025EA2882|nr:uncharacterized protein LOC131172900 [Hevea brasiliensis]
MAYEVNGDVPGASEIWFLDSSCSSHMTGMKSVFKELDESQKIRVTLGDVNPLQVEGKDTIAINTSNENGISRGLTAPYTPVQNIVAEQKNYTIVEMARSLLQARGLPNDF